MLEKIAKYTLVGGIFLLPLIIVPSTWMSQPGLKVSVLVTMMVMLLGVMGAIFWRKGSVLVPYNSLWAIGGVVLVGYALSAFFSENIARSLLSYSFNTDSLVMVGLSFMFGILVSLAILNGVVSRSLVQRTLAISIALTAVLFSVQVLAYAGVLPKMLGLGGMLPITSWINVAMILGFGALLVLSLQETCPVWRLAILMAIMLVTMSLFANVILVWILLALVAMSTLVRAVLKKQINLKGYALPLMILLFALPILADNYMWGGKAVAYIQNATKVSFIDVRPSWGSTLSVGKEVLLVDANTMLFGSGVGSFDTQWRIHKPLAVNASDYWSVAFSTAIGFIPTSIITGGFVVFAGWALFLIALTWYVLRHRSYTGYAALFMWIMAVALPLDVVGMMLAFIAVGLFVAQLSMNEHVRSVRFKLDSEGRSWLAIASIGTVAVLTLGGVIVSGQRIVADVLMQRAAQALIAGNSNAAELMLLRAKPFADKVMIEQGYTQVAIAQLQKIMQDSAAASTTPDQELLTATLGNILGHAKKAIELDSTNPANYIALGTITEQLAALQVPGAAETAITAYEKAAQLDKKNPGIQVQLARLYIAQKNIEKGEAALKQAIELKGNYIPALYDYGVLSLSKGDTSTAIQAFLGAVQLNPNYANALYYLAVALTQENRFADALVAMERVQQLNADNAEVAAIVNTLRSKVQETTASSTATTTASTTTE